MITPGLYAGGFHAAGELRATGFPGVIMQWFTLGSWLGGAAAVAGA